MEARFVPSPFYIMLTLSGKIFHYAVKIPRLVMDGGEAHSMVSGIMVLDWISR